MPEVSLWQFRSTLRFQSSNQASDLLGFWAQDVNEHRWVAFGSSTLVKQWAKETISPCRYTEKKHKGGTPSLLSMTFASYHPCLPFQMISWTQRKRKRESSGGTGPPSTAASCRLWSASLSGPTTPMLLCEKTSHAGWTSLKPECR